MTSLTLLSLVVIWILYWSKCFIKLVPSSFLGRVMVKTPN